MPLIGQDEQELGQALIEERIATLRDTGIADSDEILRTYEAAQSWLNSAVAHSRDAARLVAELTEAPLRESLAQDRLDAMEFEDVAADNLEPLSREDLEAELLLTQSELRDANERRDILDRRLAARETNAEAARARLGKIATRLAQIPDQTAGIDPTAPPSLAEANQWLLRAELTALWEERRALSAQLDGQPGRYSALQAERAEVLFNIDRLMRRAAALAARSRSKRSAPAAVAPLNLESGTPAYEIGTRYQVLLLDLSERQRLLETRLAEIQAQREMVERATRVVIERFARAKRMVQFATQSDAIGGALLASWRELEDLRLDSPRSGVPRQIGDMVISRIHHEEQLAAIVSASTYLNAWINDAGVDAEGVQAQEREALLSLVRLRRELLRNIIAAESGVIDALSELEADYARHAAKIADYQQYLEPLVLWIPSSKLLWKTNFSVIASEVPALGRSIGRVETSLQPTLFTCLILALSILLFSGRLRRYQTSLNRFTTRPREDSVVYTLIALVISALRSMPPALFVIAFASLFSKDDSASAIAFTEALNNLAPVLFAVTLLNNLCKEHGIASSHFRWGGPACDRLRYETRWFMFWLLPVATVAGFLHHVEDAAALLGRLAILGVAVMLMLHFSLSLWKAIKLRSAVELSTNEISIRFLLAVVSVAVAVGVVVGLRHSASVVINTLLQTLTAGIGLTIVHGILLRWLQVVRKHLRFTELLAARQERTEEGSSEPGTIEEDKANLLDVGEENRQLLNTATIVAALSILYYLWAPIFPIFGATSGITLWTSISVVEGETIVDKITLNILAMVVLLAGITLYAARKLPALVELVLRSRTDVSAGARYTTSTLLNYLIIGTGILVALSTLGLDWSKLQWLIAALGVGIGFGLQDIVANFISGLIILFERPISVGDVISVGDKDGIVTRIRIRSTTIRDWDNKELLIPNREIITDRLLNWSLTDTRFRVAIPVGITYDSDVVLALKILHEVVADDERVLVDPAPSIIFAGFGDNSLDLVCRYFIDNISKFNSVRTALHLEIFKRFTEAGIVIAFPQRDVHLDSEQPLRIALQHPSDMD